MLDCLCPPLVEFIGKERRTMARLRRLLITLSVTWFVFSFVCSSSAQDDRHPRGVLGWARVLNQAAVQKELKLSAEQLKVVKGCV